MLDSEYVAAISGAAYAALAPVFTIARWVVAASSLFKNSSLVIRLPLSTHPRSRPSEVQPLRLVIGGHHRLSRGPGQLYVHQESYAVCRALPVLRQSRIADHSIPRTEVVPAGPA